MADHGPNVFVEKMNLDHVSVHICCRTETIQGFWGQEIKIGDELLELVEIILMEFRTFSVTKQIETRPIRLV